jgi:predicted RNA-binding Zn ribbon-like protein
MSKQSQKFKVPDELANLYDFANSLDVRRFTHQGVQHRQDDELKNPQALTAWMMQRRLVSAGAQLSAAMFETALTLRAEVRDYLQRNPVDRRDRKVARALSETMAAFPLLAVIGSGGEAALRPARDDALSGLSAIVAELYDGSRNGTLDRLKMCAAEECRRVFFDRSKPATRRWCMSSLCGNRMKTRAYRERRRDME